LTFTRRREAPLGALVVGLVAWLGLLSFELATAKPILLKAGGAMGWS